MGNVLEFVGKRIRQIRKAKGYSQAALGEKCGFTFSYIGGVERAEKNISLLNLEKIAVALQVELYEFFMTPRHHTIIADREDALKELIFYLSHRDSEEINKALSILKKVFD